MKSVQFGFARTNMISEVAINEGMALFVSVLYGHALATLMLLPFTYILDGKARSVTVTFTALCEIFLSAVVGSTLNQRFYSADMGYSSPIFSRALSNMVAAVMATFFRLERLGTLSLAGKAKVVGAIIWMGGVMFVTLCKEITRNLWSWPFLLTEGNASTDDDESVSENLMKGSLLFVANLFGLISQCARPPQDLALQEKGPVSFSLRRPNSRRRIALAVFLLMNIAFVSMAAARTVVSTETASSAREGVPVGDKLPPNCHVVVHCADCFPCYESGGHSVCCDS